ncbi:MAG: 3-phosphoserine/phosphohydroxythreonine transaminase [Gemmatimonadota bacterium]|nr:MAG: 3-phosphoserine/phosphohydroxythreonine transaminase [Gemmatimonadota bacterium]
MATRIWNFNPGPATLPLPVLEKIKEEIPDYGGTGMAVMELSHRSKPYAAIHAETKNLLVQLLGIPENFSILFLQGGASLQFAMVPMNLLGNGKSADYVITGAWSKKALKEAKILGSAKVAGSSEDTNFNRIPEQSELTLDPDTVYVHITSNNTIAGTQWMTFPDTGDIPIVSDMSSDILSRQLDFSRFGLIYAGAQKNLGPSGVTVVIIRNDLAEQSREDIPTLLRYATHVDKDSLFNTPPTFAIYIVKLVLEWMKDQGGLEAVEKINQEKGKLLYNTIDVHNEFYRGTVEPDSRSLMNATFRLPTEELEGKFIAEGLESGFGGLKGHRSVGGIRVSMYNAMPLEGIKALTDFMVNFVKNNG